MKFADFEAWTLQASPKNRFMSGAWVMQKLRLQRTCFRVCISLLLPRHDLESSLADMLLAQPADPQRSSADSAIPCSHYLSPRG